MALVLLNLEWLLQFPPLRPFRRNQLIFFANIVQYRAQVGNSPVSPLLHRRRVGSHFQWRRKKKNEKRKKANAMQIQLKAKE